MAIKNSFILLIFFLTNSERFVIIPFTSADVAHLVERHLAKVEVASSSLVIRSRKKDGAKPSFLVL